MSKLFEEMVQGLEEARAYMEGERKGYRVSLPAEVDVKAIRKRLSMTQARFSDTFGFSLDAVKHWEGGRRTPESSARAFLTVIARDPDAVISALHQPVVANTAKLAAAKKNQWRKVTKTRAVKGTRPRKQASAERPRERETLHRLRAQGLLPTA
jgi:putative transcriptional regulator